MPELVLYGIRLLAQASLGKLSTNESGPVCLDLPVGPAAQEDVGDEGVPLDAVDRAVVGSECCQELRAVLGGAVVNMAQLGPHQVQAGVIRLERDALNSV